MKTVAIIEGWTGGKKLSKQFRQALVEADLKVIKDPSQADVIVAQSAGVYKIPGRHRAQIIMLIGIPYWPGKNILGRMVRKTRVDSKRVLSEHGPRYFLKKVFWQIYYFFARPTLLPTAFKNHKQLDFLDTLSRSKVIVIRNSMDMYSSPDIGEELRRFKNIKFVELEGGHDSYYTDHSPYIDLILKEL